MKVSICVITYNREKFIAEAIDSILFQTFQNWELVIVDDGSQDDTEQIVKTYKDPRISYVRNDTNQGIVASRNTALAQATGEYIAVLDSDDIWNDPTKLATQVAFLDSHAEYALVGCANIQIIDGQGTVVSDMFQPVEDSEIRKHMLYKNPFTHSSILFRRSVISEMGSYHDYAVGEDYELCLRIGMKYKMKNIADLSMQYRKHSGNISVQKRMQALRLNIAIIRTYKEAYPRFFMSIFRRYIRFVIGLCVLS